MIFIEYFSNDLLVEHTVAPSGKKTTCDETMKGKLPARPVDIRAAAKGKTSYTTCLDCAVADEAHRVGANWRTFKRG